MFIKIFAAIVFLFVILGSFLLSLGRYVANFTMFLGVIEEDLSNKLMKYELKLLNWWYDTFI